MSECQCTGAGWCERHGVNKTEHLVSLCQTNDRYWAAWEAGRGPGQLRRSESPPVRIRAKGFGPGTELCRMLGCGCGVKSRMSEMNKWGADGCREHFDEIVAWMVGCENCGQGSIDETAARRLLNMAIERSKK